MGLVFLDLQPLQQQKCSGKNGVLAQPGFDMHHKNVLNFDPSPSKWLRHLCMTSQRKVNMLQHFLFMIHFA